jgi:homoserine kinase type II
MSWLNDPANLHALLTATITHFELGTLLSWSRTSGNANKNYFVTTDKGEFLIKLVLNHPREDIEKELTYLQRLQQHAFPAAYYLAAPDGSLYYLYENTPIAVQSKLPGSRPFPSPQINRVIGEQLARLHTIPHDALPKKSSWMDSEYLPGAIALLQQHFPVEETRKITDLYDSLRHFDPTALPQSIIHGDLFSVNTLFVDTTLSAIIDWEEVTVGASLIDFALCFTEFCFPQNTFQPSLYQSLLDGYMQVRAFCQNELDQLETAVKYAGLTASAYNLLQFGLYYPDEQRKKWHNFFWDMGLDTWKLSL